MAPGALLEVSVGASNPGELLSTLSPHLKSQVLEERASLRPMVDQEEWLIPVAELSSAGAPTFPYPAFPAHRTPASEILERL